MSKNQIKYQLKSIASDLHEESDKIRSVANIVSEGWNGKQAMRYLMELEDFMKNINCISNDIDELIFDMDREIQLFEKMNVEDADVEE